ncbi:hypothetical protein [Nocardia sp. alder85J]|uniref:hypothetical protein n=1 Tax=Nocardia sp. alder85J TaxID=2862949 RepID=UPI001CD46389|nr:hypothetical protein [Nocardia sp. alder85J]MCX4097317.1 hypothetical protein [Nocardia sp. alder85J]
MTIREFFRLPETVADAPIYGAPVETADGTTVITVARPGGWPRVPMRPVGIFVVREGTVTWAPAEDHTRIALLGETIGLVAATIATLAILRRPPWPDLVLRRDVGAGPH